MEDSHSFFYDFQDVKNQGFFAIFDGHGGKSAADWCGEHYHEVNKGECDRCCDCRNLCIVEGASGETCA